MKGLAATLRREIIARKVDFLVLDGLISASESAATAREFKKFIHELQIQADLAECTMLLLTSASVDPDHASAEYTMVDGLLELQTRLRGRRSERDLVIHKVRGSDFMRGVHSFHITDQGIAVQPRIEALLSEPTQPTVVEGPRISLGVDTLDVILGGGPLRRSTTLVMGPAGVGKTTLGLHFLGAGKDEPAVYLSFDEAPEAIRLKAKTLNLPVSRLFDEDVVKILWRPSTEGVLDEVCAAFLDLVRSRKTQRVFIDGISDFARTVSDEDRLGPVLTALTNEFRSLGFLRKPFRIAAVLDIVQKTLT